ncbi:hypothetical protein EBA01_18670 [Xanthomonas oryzae pv. oryzae]|nr:hypothetical protein BVV16_19010 [Xanthomonas oryzae pv. oryzae]AUI95424.1 hypothetical protein BVV17_19040 [Xanthomonas oryzae pv. oryzae]AUI99096.1 hypothetical protein BVV18_19040 [Xanthomonas oryzae pv. oryzae]AUJ02771.1 hypothetical protein BVV10_19005 [Xanthomonas oryzae pv. oryzae]AUJ06440.1 hypothetical protein BVV19_19085 [Xanthomonas oryzae pv. oryzae]
MICSSEKRFFTSNLLGLGNWTPSRCATQTWGDVACRTASILNASVYRLLLMDTSESVIFYDLEMSRKHWAYHCWTTRPGRTGTVAGTSERNRPRCSVLRI